MSDTRRVAHDTKRDEGDMSEMAVIEARERLVFLTIREHRGPADTWTAARDRTARKIGLDPSYARRLWQRWQDMKDVSGGAYRSLLLAYQAQCDRLDEIGDRYDRKTKDLLNEAHGEKRRESGPESHLLLAGQLVPPPTSPLCRAGQERA
ncbi:hypothetical protein [Aurantimonas endophytica]|uniref:Uncharacterized protein n=1 Tax=Aurantimonas endophytica TaxID=1522175 RepID=A0A7W6HFT6_9HYPH|nr:hypothetical protein [Aurantimonas endophytica]MBB4004450.1 hypothetical protein [Aurantimonas endophytica]MCO6405286.1 hypothetical protein [Aurantimonas endophytica]